MCYHLAHGSWEFIQVWMLLADFREMGGGLESVHV